MALDSSYLAVAGDHRGIWARRRISLLTIDLKVKKWNKSDGGVFTINPSKQLIMIFLDMEYQQIDIIQLKPVPLKFVWKI